MIKIMIYTRCYRKDASLTLSLEMPSQRDYLHSLFALFLALNIIPDSSITLESISTSRPLKAWLCFTVSAFSYSTLSLPN